MAKLNNEGLDALNAGYFLLAGRKGSLIIRRYNVLFALAVLALLLVFSGCGGGGSNKTAPPINDQLFLPNYVNALYDKNINKDDGGLFYWDHLPVRVAFDPSSPWSNPYPTDPNFKAEAADEWDQPEKQMVQVVSYGSPADVVVRLVHQSEFPGSSIRGMTDYRHDTSGYMISATIRVALDDDNELVSSGFTVSPCSANILTAASHMNGSESIKTPSISKIIPLIIRTILRTNAQCRTRYE